MNSPESSPMRRKSLVSERFKRSSLKMASLLVGLLKLNITG